ncbi:Hir3p KNAG_0B06880 [Huiozyma naganishii CBS 8797]|uniref:Histone transcription regulator 3 homolog n=1 Tax=Huiozyma naganishii (strain ATCC MYA-139 / BCRC 22969 / CBS 8797 / KCTC 17520 / NBRC 10181 / NCYC 3082 / Yp74L-3) TaxID=1071383 RepID=J7RVX6_HUIN7|nr:hypothetical protein KNAG_0B06880 [Kazachstania naganishii CBS 8797]CCK69112.1 hypothetical protein KNAG_0B06880 [Kazachstania naganishii CBS 8797]
MSTFDAVNLSPLEELNETEEHSRELQIEEGFKIYQEALMAMKEAQFELSDNKFTLLFQLNIMQPDKWGFYRYNSPTLDRLRYLSYRNRGMLYYRWLIHRSELDEKESIGSADIVTDILKVIENLVESLQHSDADTSVSELLLELFHAFKSQRLKRLILETELNKRDNRLFLVRGRRRCTVLPQLKNIIGQYKTLLFDIGDPITKEKPTSTLRPTLNSILSEIYQLKTEDEITMKKTDCQEILLKTLDWDVFIKSIRELMPSIKFSSLFSRNSDPYSELDFPIESLKFNIEVPTGEKFCEEAQSVESMPRPKNTDDDLVISGGDGAAKDIKQENDSLESAPKNENQSNSIVQGADDALRKGTKRSNDNNDTPRQRSSKRFKERNSSEDVMPIGDSNNSAHINLFLNLESLMKTVGCGELPLKYEQLSVSVDGATGSSNMQYICRIVFDCLKNWSTWHTNIYNKKSVTTTVDENVKLNSLLKSNTLDESESAQASMPPLSAMKLEILLNDVNKQMPHFHELRFLILSFLLGQNSDERLVVDYIWTPELFKMVQWFVMSIESNLYSYFVENISQNWHFALSVYEILVNMAGSLAEEMALKKSQGNKTSELRTQMNKLEKKIERLSVLLSANEKELKAQETVCMKWVHYSLLQYSKGTTNGQLMEALESLSELLQSLPPTFNVIYPNYQYISNLSAGAISSQLRKLKMVESLTFDKSDSTDDTPGSIEHIKLLESVLSYCLTSSKDDNMILNKDMVEFILKSPFTLKIRLWDILFSHYLKMDDRLAVLRTYFGILQLLIDEILSFETREEKSMDSSISNLLTALSTIGSFTGRVVNFLQSNHWELSDGAVDESRMRTLLQAFFLFYLLFFYGGTSTDNNTKSFFERATKSSARMKEQTTSLISLIIVYFHSLSKKLNTDTDGVHTINLISCFHEFLGHFLCCDAAHTSFLLIAETLLCKFTNELSYMHLKQIMWCRYHFLISGDGHSVSQHPTHPNKMEKSNALTVGVYLIKLNYRTVNPLLLSTNKTSLKQVLDTIIETIGDPLEVNDYCIVKNKHSLKDYLNSPITTTLFQDALKGANNIKFTTPNIPLSQAMDTGLFYVVSVHSLNQYMIRKKSMQARPSELDAIIKTLKCDIIYNTSRFESWYLLGKCFSYIVEDDLIWTADKLAILDKKRMVALAQRKSILCYIKSLTIYHSRNEVSDGDEKILQMVLEALGNELTNGYYKPMNKLCFCWRQSDSILRMNENFFVSEENAADISTISDFNIEQAILLCLTQANNLEQQSCNWANYLAISKTLSKLNREESQEPTIENILESCRRAIKDSEGKDFILEPHYMLIKTCYKLVKRLVLGPKKALNIMEFDKEVLGQNAEFWTIDENTSGNERIEKEFYHKVIAVLRHLITLDRRKWHHRPQYRIAKILFEDFDDVTGALEEMNKVVSLKSSKNLVSIWKPEYERPGKHFVYAYEYVVFYIKLLFERSDYNSIAQLLKKIRRFSSGMLYVPEATDIAIKAYVKAAVKKLDIDEKYIEHLLPILSYQDFLHYSVQLQKEFVTSKYSDEHLMGLKLSFQLKKGNNGIAFDLVCLSIYFKYFYLPFLGEKKGTDNVCGSIAEEATPPMMPLPTFPDKPTPINNTNNKAISTRKRVSKKETFDRIKSLVEKIPDEK